MFLHPYCRTHYRVVAALSSLRYLFYAVHILNIKLPLQSLQLTHWHRTNSYVQCRPPYACLLLPMCKLCVFGMVFLEGSFVNRFSIVFLDDTPILQTRVFPLYITTATTSKYQSRMTPNPNFYPSSECFIIHCSCLKTKFEESFPVLLTRMVRICFRPWPNASTASTLPFTHWASFSTAQLMSISAHPPSSTVQVSLTIWD